MENKNRGFTAPPSDIAEDFDKPISYEEYMNEWLDTVEQCWIVDSDGNELV